MTPYKKTLYGLGNLSNGIVLQAITSYLIFFSTTILGISGTLVGLIVAISVAWDAISDLLVGYFSDRTHGPLGKRHPYMLIGTFGLAISNGFMWYIDGGWSMTSKVLMLFISIMLVKTLMTIFVTPYNALGSELSLDYYERTSIQAYRTVFFTFGLAFTTVAGMIFYFGPNEAYNLGQLNPLAYRTLGQHISMIVLVCGLSATLSTWKQRQIYKQPKRGEGVKQLSIKEELQAVFGNKNYLYVAGAYLSANIATAILGAIGLHVFTYTFQMNNLQIGLIFGITFGLSIVSQGYFLKLTKDQGKKRAALKAVQYALVGSLIFLVMVAFKGLVTRAYWLLILYAIPSGIGVGGLITLPFSMVSDTVDEEELMTGQRSEGLFFGGLTFAYKISQSVAIFLVGILLDLVGFDAQLVSQTPFTSTALGLVIGIGTLVAMLSARSFYQKYGLSKEQLMSVKAALSEK